MPRFFRHKYFNWSYYIVIIQPENKNLNDFVFFRHKWLEPQYQVAKYSISLGHCLRLVQKGVWEEVIPNDEMSLAFKNAKFVTHWQDAEGANL